MSGLEAFQKALEKEDLDGDKEIAPECFLSTGYAPLNWALSNDINLGLPCGRIVEIMGESSSGKTMIATQLMISAQKQNGFAAFFDHELSYDARLSIKQGLDVAKSKFLYKEGESFENSIVKAIKLASLIREHRVIPEKAPIVMIFDSLAMMVPKSKLDKEVDEFTMNDNTALSRATSAVLPAFAKQCRKLNILAVFLNQVRDAFNMYGPKTTSPGGKSMGFAASIRIELSGKEIYEGETVLKKQLVGKTVTAKVIKNKITAPGKSVSWDFKFNEDGSGNFDVLGGYLEWLIKIGALDSGGARVLWNGKNLYRSQIREELEASPDYLEVLDKVYQDWKEKND